MSRYKAYTDEELACLIARDDSTAYTEIYDRYSEVLYLHICRKLGDRETAKDLIHDVFATLWDNRRKLDVRGRVSIYLYAAVRYKVINVLRRDDKLVHIKASLKHDAPSSNTPAPDEILVASELQLLIEAEAERLPRRMRQVFLMSRQQQLSHQEISQQLEISPETVKKQISNALRILRLKFKHLLTLSLVVMLSLEEFKFFDTFHTP